ncbi:uncharacterized protein CEXT_464111 [Caerostris extrusa]|uniref:Ig-like domain-containing protein n=1 Tax=Caerostris extrusa TaxID=172846 RepID=A0AAV4VNP9_CAEEX|nr:uncharacterized protein CEXT_464111 [Caerostris extrusa]
MTSGVICVTTACINSSPLLFYVQATFNDAQFFFDGVLSFLSFLLRMVFLILVFLCDSKLCTLSGLHLEQGSPTFQPQGHTVNSDSTNWKKAFNTGNRVPQDSDDVWLNCTYDLEKETLYSIKWHKNDVEFYRYIPADVPPGQKYELEGIHIDLTRSSKGNIYMPTTDVNSEGIYRCEVSSEAPIFRTVRGRGR